MNELCLPHNAMILLPRVKEAVNCYRQEWTFQRFLMQPVVRKGGEKRTASVAGQDIYASTAPLVVKAAQEILQSDVRTAGTCAPGEIFNAEEFLRALAAESPSVHLEVQLTKVPPLKGLHCVAGDRVKVQ